jgi:hypothetical protein
MIRGHFASSQAHIEAAKTRIAQYTAPVIAPKNIAPRITDAVLGLTGGGT